MVTTSCRISCPTCGAIIRTTTRSTPHQAIPLWGTYWGEPDDEVAMEVAVNVKSETGVANHSAGDTCKDPPTKT